MKRLAIISHTEHYKTKDGQILGLGSTVTEINHLLSVFDEIIHIAMLHTQEPPPNVLPYLSERITFVAIPAVGGPKLLDKLDIIFKAPQIIAVVNAHLKLADWFQFRAPTGIGVFLIPYLMYFRKNKRGWFKYAGNWKQEAGPLGYKVQKWMLLKQSRLVTMNGSWPKQPRHCLSFENPCLTYKEMMIGNLISIKKQLNFPIHICFVGRLETAKGFDLIIEAISDLDNILRSKIHTVHAVGAGPKTDLYKKLARENDLPIVFHGHLSRIDVHKIYEKSHAIILPSASEGFPKVIIEAMNYGCIPIVSDVSSISQYIKHKENGFLIKQLNVKSVLNILSEFLNLSEKEYERIRHNEVLDMYKFSYSFYNSRIKDEII